MKRFDVLNHPVRLRVALLLYQEAMTTNQIHAALGDVPKPSLYRHLQRMLAEGVIKVADARMVHGIEERFYTTVKEELHLTPEDIERGINTDDFADFVRLLSMIHANEAATIIESMPQLDINALAIRDYDIYATQEEFAALRAALWRLLDAAEQQPPTPDRKLWRLQVIGYSPSDHSKRQHQGDNDL
jgi:DNA-binding transcriptional ArsR family regulator